MTVKFAKAEFSYIVEQCMITVFLVDTWKWMNNYASTSTVRHLPVSECLLGLRWRGFAGEGWLPVNPIQQRLAAGAQRAARAWRQHGGINLHLLIEGAEFYGGDGSTVGVEAQGEGHVAEDVLGSKVNDFPRVCYQLYVGYGWVVWGRERDILI